MKPAITLLAATLALSLVACADDAAMPDESAPAATSRDGTAPAGNTGPAMTPDVNAPSVPGNGAPGSEADRKALAAVAEVDRHEIAAAGDALAKNVQGEVRSYAEALRDDHTRNLEATRRLMGDTVSDGDMGAHYAQNTAAGSAAGPDAPGSATAGPAQPDPELSAMKDKQDAERQRLAALEGEAFATAWVAAMVKGHEEALAKLDNELIPGAGDQRVRQHLQDTRAAVSRHLDAARALQSSTVAN